MIIMDKRVYLAIMLILCSVLPSALHPIYSTGLFINFFSLSAIILSIFLAFLIYRASEGETRFFMKCLSLSLIFQLIFIASAVNMLLHGTFELSLLFVPALLTYLPLAVYGIRKLSLEIKFLTPNRLILPTLFSVALFITIFMTSKPDLMLPLLLLDLIIVFVFLSLLSVYLNAETYIYWLMVSLAFLLQFPAKVLLSLNNYNPDYFYTIPAILYNLSLSTYLLCLYDIYSRRVKILNLKELEEKLRNYSILLDKLNELKEAFRLMNQALRYDVLKKLQIISGYVESYELTNDPSFLQKAVKNVKECGEYIEKIGSLEKVISSEKVELRPIDVKKVVEEVKANYEKEIIVKGFCTAMGDDNLYLVIENLIDNAVRHSGTDRVEVVLSEIGGEVEIRVIDYGTGIPAEIKKELFKEAFRYGESAGLGLGLYIVKKIVERYGGRVWVEDSKPKGATFVVRLRTTQTSEHQ